MGCDSQGHPIVRIGSERPPIAEVGFAMFRFVAALRVLLLPLGIALLIASSQLTKAARRRTVETLGSCSVPGSPGFLARSLLEAPALRVVLRSFLSSGATFYFGDAPQAHAPSRFARVFSVKTWFKVLGSIALVSVVMLSGCNGGSTSGSFLEEHPSSRMSTHRFPTSSCLTAACIYVAQANYSKSKLSIFTASATGNVPPVETISGRRTQLSLLRGGVAVGADHKVFASDLGSITVYAAGIYGNAKPVQTISGGNTGLDSARKLTVDADDNIYVANSDNGGSNPSITVYATGANGNATPTQTITGSNTGLNNTYDVAVDSSGHIYAVNPGNSSVTVFASGATGNASPIQNISGSYTGMSEPLGIAIDASRNIYVCNGGSITVYAAGATGNVAPMRTIFGTKTKIANPWGIALDSSGKLYVAINGGQLLVFAAGANGNVKPIQTIKGSYTKLGSLPLFAIAVQ